MTQNKQPRSRVRGALKVRTEGALHVGGHEQPPTFMLRMKRLKGACRVKSGEKSKGHKSIPGDETNWHLQRLERGRCGACPGLGRGPCGCRVMRAEQPLMSLEPRRPQKGF